LGREFNVLLITAIARAHGPPRRLLTLLFNNNAYGRSFNIRQWHNNQIG
jgi:hypothetical protein